MSNIFREEYKLHHRCAVGALASSDGKPKIKSSFYIEGNNVQIFAETYAGGLGKLKEAFRASWARGLNEMIDESRAQSSGGLRALNPG